LPRRRREAADAAADLGHSFTTLAEKARQAGAVVAATFDRPYPGAWRVTTSEPHCPGVAAAVSGSRCLRDNGSRASIDDCEGVLISMGVDTDHVVQLVCKHQTDPPTRRVRYAGLEQGNRAAGL
jgi:hypothetical protein